MTAPHRNRPVAIHGTRAGYNRHLRLGETPCDACREANTDYNRARRQGLADVREAIRAVIIHGDILFAHNADDEWSPVWAYPRILGQDGMPLRDWITATFGRIPDPLYYEIRDDLMAAVPPPTTTEAADVPNPNRQLARRAEIARLYRRTGR